MVTLLTPSRLSERSVLMPSMLLMASSRRSETSVSTTCALAPGYTVNTDTTGGNSGSPILNAKGEIVGVNFDRAWGATINDFAWNEAYSRSIGVDIRYVLWVTDKVAGARPLLSEMGIR